MTILLQTAKERQGMSVEDDLQMRPSSHATSSHHVAFLSPNGPRDLITSEELLGRGNTKRGTTRDCGVVDCTSILKSLKRRRRYFMVPDSARSTEAAKLVE